MKVKDIHVGDEYWFLGDRIKVTRFEKSDLWIEIVYDIINDLFNFGQYSFHVFWKCDWDKDIESFQGKHIDEEL